MVSIRGVHHVSFTVTDRPRSVEWYTRVLGFEVVGEVERETFTRTRMAPPDGAVTVTFTQHDGGGSDPFDERRTGMDHISFRVASREDLEALRQRLAEHGVDHSEIKQLSERAAMITFRDPDNIQLEATAIED